MPLTDLQRKKLGMMNASLGKNNMQQLSTGRYVEEVMMEFAIHCDEDHPAWSLVLDVNDEEYKKYFSEGELAEIRSWRH